MISSRRIRITLLAAGNSIHTVRWANTLSRRNYDVHLVTLNSIHPELSPQVKVHKLPFPAPAGYLLNIPFLRSYLKKNPPDILHAHYAAGYGTLGRFAGRRPYLLSVWGSDVYVVPNHGHWKKRTVEKNLQAADWICSTSKAMADQTRSITSQLKGISITPFGIDIERFCKFDAKRGSELTIGTIKTLDPVYGIDILIRAFAKCLTNLQESSPAVAERLRLRIVGGGPELSNLEQLAESLGIAEATHFVGPVPHEMVPHELQKMDIFVAASRSESFGVSVLEANACQLPVVVTNVGGLPEIVIDGETGLIVEPDDPDALSEKLTTLIVDPALREQLGENGRVHVAENFSWDTSVDIMETVYSKLLSEFGGMKTQFDLPSSPQKTEADH